MARDWRECQPRGYLGLDLALLSTWPAFPVLKEQPPPSLLSEPGMNQGVATVTLRVLTARNFTQLHHPPHPTHTKPSSLCFTSLPIQASLTSQGLCI